MPEEITLNPNKKTVISYKDHQKLNKWKSRFWNKIYTVNYIDSNENKINKIIKLNFWEGLGINHKNCKKRIQKLTNLQEKDLNVKKYSGLPAENHTQKHSSDTLEKSNSGSKQKLPEKIRWNKSDMSKIYAANHKKLVAKPTPEEQSDLDKIYSSQLEEKKNSQSEEKKNSQSEEEYLNDKEVGEFFRDGPPPFLPPNNETIWESFLSFFRIR